MNKNSLYLVVIVGLLMVSFVVGLVLVKPSEKGLVESLPIVGTWFARNRQDKLPMVTDEMLEDTFEAGGVRKGQTEGNVLVYLVMGRLVEDVKVRVDGMIEGKMVVEGYLQSQPLAFLAGSVNWNLQGGEYNL